MHSTSAALLFVLVATASVGRTMCDTYDCKGSSLCSSTLIPACNDAVNNKLIRNDAVNYGAPGSGRAQTGACSTVISSLGCGVFIQGASGCARTGNQMWHDYQDIRSSGCKVCGSKHWGAGCLTTINYVSGCSSSGTFSE